VAITDRLKRLEANNPRLCEEQPCMRIYCTQRRVRSDGTQELIFPPGRDAWQVVDTESVAEGEGGAVIKVLYDD
jgi:hypothetical protein